MDLTVFTIVCCALMTPFLAYLIFQFVLWVKNRKSRPKKEKYVYYEVDCFGNATKIE